MAKTIKMAKTIYMIGSYTTGVTKSAPTLEEAEALLIKDYAIDDKYNFIEKQTAVVIFCPDENHTEEVIFTEQMHPTYEELPDGTAICWAFDKTCTHKGRCEECQTYTDYWKEREQDESI